MINIDLSDPDRQKAGREIIRDLVGAYLAQEELTGNDAQEVLLRAYEPFQGQQDSVETTTELMFALQEAGRQILALLGLHATDSLQAKDSAWAERVNSDDPALRQRARDEFRQARRRIWNAHLLDLE